MARADVLRLPPAVHGALAAAVLALLTLWLHGNALQMGWRHDDPAHLRFVAAYQPWQYFTLREVMLEQSYAHITPWNALFYDIGLPLFGLNAVGHHAHLLAVVWAIAWGTWWLLNERVGPAGAWVGAAMFLMMPPTGAMAQLLMTGHYAYGLLFTVLTLWCWSRAVEQFSVRWACLAASGYALACLCKEIYVPLPAILMFWPSTGWRNRVRLLLPVVVIAMAYLVCRLWLFGGVGGYAGLADASGRTSWIEMIVALGRSLNGVRQTLFGTGVWAVCSLGLSAALLVTGVAQGWRPVLSVVGSALLMLFIPIGPVLAAIGQEGIAARFLVLVGWALAVLLASSLKNAGKVRVALASLLALMLVPVQHANGVDIERRSRFQQWENQFVLDRAQVEALQPDRYVGNGYLQSLTEAKRMITGKLAPHLVRDEGELVEFGPQAGRQVWAWSEACTCIRPLEANWDRRAADFESGLRLGRSLDPPMAVVVSLRGEGRIRRFEWRVHGPAGRLFLELPQFGRKEVPYISQFPFGIDATVRLAESFTVRAVIETPEGGLVRSPPLVVSTERDSTVEWQARSVGSKD